MRINTLQWLLLAVMVSLAGPAWAQDGDGEEAGEAADESAAPQASEADNSAAEAAIERDLALFWGARRKVKIVQKRLYEKEGRFEITPAFSIIPNDDFILYYPIGGRIGYHLTEAFDVELSYAFAIDQDSELTTFLKDVNDPQIIKEAVIREQIEMFYGIDLLWSPLYGKLSALGLKLTHFDTYVGLGAGIFHTKTFQPENPDGEGQVKPAGHTVLGFRWFITDLINIRTEYRHHFFEKEGGGVSTPVELSLGVGFLL